MIGYGQLLIFGVFIILSMIIGNVLKSKFKKYSKIPINYGMTGREVAEKMLQENGISNVQVKAVKGELTDHYNPANKTVNLSPEVYHGNSVASAAIAAHECGHAVQHAHAYAPLQLRSALVPIQNVSAKVMNFIFMAMFLGAFLLPGIVSFNSAIVIIAACYGVFTLFAFITLPVEINASQRALVWLNGSGVTDRSTHEQAKDALKWAAYTYVVAALSSLAMLIYYLSLISGRRN
ncbi:MAG: zinc metallopeptidase [Bacteroidales bacterium]|nr:zinc metallopeptidase [Bacteroidales bacterium]